MADFSDYLEESSIAIPIKSFNPHLTFIGGEKIKQIIAWRRLRYSQIGRELGGYSRAYVCMIVNGKYIPTYEMRMKFANYFQLPMEDLWH